MPTGLETPQAHGCSRLLRCRCRTRTPLQTGHLLGTPRESGGTSDCYVKTVGTWPITARAGQSPSGALSPPSDPAARAGHVPRTRRQGNPGHTLRILSPLATPGTPSPDYPPLQTVRCRRPPAGQPRPPLVCPACFRAPAQGAGAGRPFPEPSAQAAALSRPPPMQLTPEARQSETQGGTVTAGARAASSRCHHDPQLRLTQEESEARKEHGI